MNLSQLQEYSRDIVSVFRNLWRPCPEALTFIHIPKCAGTSLRRVLSRCYKIPTSRRIEDLRHLRVIRAALSGPRQEFTPKERLQILDTAERLGLYAMLSDIPLVMGHFPFNVERFQEVIGRRRFLTVLRHPVERWISNFRNSRRANSRHPWQELNLNEFLETEYARHYGSSIVTYLAGSTQISDGLSLDHLCATAKSNLQNHFDLIGFTDSLPRLLEELRVNFGLPIGPLPRYNSSFEHPESMFEITDAQRGKISDLCAPDLAVYDFARNLQQAAI